MDSITIWVCANCAFHHANGECGDCHEDNHDEEPLRLLEPGTFAMGDETRDFDRDQCDGCGSWLHGERFEFGLWI